MKNFQITKFCDRAHNHSNFENSHKIGMSFHKSSRKTTKNGKKWILY